MVHSKQFEGNQVKKWLAVQEGMKVYVFSGKEVEGMDMGRTTSKIVVIDKGEWHWAFKGTSTSKGMSKNIK